MFFILVWCFEMGSSRELCLFYSRIIVRREKLAIAQNWMFRQFKFFREIHIEHAQSTEKWTTKLSLPYILLILLGLTWLCLELLSTWGLHQRLPNCLQSSLSASSHHQWRLCRDFSNPLFCGLVGPRPLPGYVHLHSVSLLSNSH